MLTHLAFLCVHLALQMSTINRESRRTSYLLELLLMQLWKEHPILPHVRVIL